MLTPEVKEYINRSVLCWLATSSSENIPNVSPKEIFTYYGDGHIVIANIASPQTVKNIRDNKHVCVSFIDIFVQKGFQLKGTAEIIHLTDPTFEELSRDLLKMTAGKFPFSSLTKIKVEHIKPIIAPRYLLYPTTTEEEQIQSALATYKVPAP